MLESCRNASVISTTGSMLQRYVVGPSLYDGSVANYYSPMESPEPSDDEDGKEELAYPSGGVRIPKSYKKKKNYSEKVSMSSSDQISFLDITKRPNEITLVLIH